MYFYKGFNLYVKLYNCLYFICLCIAVHFVHSYMEHCQEVSRVIAMKIYLVDITVILREDWKQTCSANNASVYINEATSQIIHKFVSKICYIQIQSN